MMNIKQKRRMVYKLSVKINYYDVQNICAKYKDTMILEQGD
jgi:hypothetical protein